MSIKKARHEQRLENATYTAAEVKVLTEAALRIGRKEAGDEIEAACEADTVYDVAARYHFARIARSTARQPPQDANSARTEAPGFMSTWNYRLTVETWNDTEVWQVREIHYDDDGKVAGWSKDSAVAVGESWKECADDLSRMSGVIGLPAYDLDAKCWVDHNRRPIDPRLHQETDERS